MDQESLSSVGSYHDIGILLCSARERRRIPIKQAAQMLHIRVRYLDALEQGRLSELPGLTYTRGYLQSYAVFLDLDKDEILRRFEAVEEAMSRKNIYFPQVFSKEKTPNSTIIWGSMAFALVVYLFWLVALKPTSAHISMVENPAEPRLQKMSVFGFATKDGACLRLQEVLYPPCTAARVPNFMMLPLSRRMDSVLDLPVKDIPVETQDE